MNLLESMKVLNVSEKISPEDLKKKYHKLALKFHPDVNKSPNAESEFKKLKAAYEYLVSHLDHVPKKTVKLPTIYRVLQEGLSFQTVEIPEIMTRDNMYLQFMIGMNEYRVLLPKAMTFPTTVKMKNLDLTLKIKTYGA